MQMCVDYSQDFRGRKRFRQRTNRTESFRFVEDLRIAVGADEKNRYLRLQCEKVCNHLETRDISQEKIDNAESKSPLARLIDSILPFCHKHNLVAVRLEHKPERVAYGRLVVNHEDR